MVPRSHQPPRRLKRALISEELIELTGDLVSAVVLNQLLYWQQRVDDFKELARALSLGEEIAEDVGWIYKSAKELGDETMLGVSPQTILRRLERLIEMGLIERRHNPKYGWDREYQYRVNIRELARRLAEIGYPLEGYTLGEQDLDTNPTIFQDGKSIFQDGKSIFQDGKSIFHSGRAIPEITTENTTDTTPQTEENALDFCAKTEVTETADKPPATAEEARARIRDALAACDSQAGKRGIASRQNELLEIAQAIAEVCHLDFKLNRSRLLKEASLLMQASSVKPTPSLIREKYGENGWFYRHTWQGKKSNTPPMPGTIRLTWNQWNDGGESGIPVVSEIAAIQAVVDQRLAGRSFASESERRAAIIEIEREIEHETEGMTDNERLEYLRKLANKSTERGRTWLNLCSHQN